MTKAVSDLLEATKQMSLEERLDLVDGIWQMIEGDVDRDEWTLSDEDQKNLKSRIEDWRQHPETSLTLDQVKALFEAAKSAP
jgi:putative addiction module component (TIGR02574 family)